MLYKGKTSKLKNEKHIKRKPNFSFAHEHHLISKRNVLLSRGFFNVEEFPPPPSSVFKRPSYYTEQQQKHIKRQQARKAIRRKITK